MKISCIEHQILSLPSLLWPLILSGSQFLEPVKKRQFLRFIHTTVECQLSGLQISGNVGQPEYTRNSI